MTIDAGEITNRPIINDWFFNKSPGLDGLTAEHMKYADSKLLVLLSALVSSILVHGYIPKVITECVIIPIIKDKNRRVNDKGNYTPICLSNVVSKIVEAVLLNRMAVYLQTTSHQFGFKSKHGTDLYVFAFKELLRFYTKHGSAVHVAF